MNSKEYENLKKSLKGKTFKEKVKIIFDEDGTLTSSLTPEEKRETIIESFSSRERNTFFDTYVPVYNTLREFRDIIYYYSMLVEFDARDLNALLMERDTQKRSVEYINEQIRQLQSNKDKYLNANLMELYNSTLDSLQSYEGTVWGKVLASPDEATGLLEFWNREYFLEILKSEETLYNDMGIAKSYNEAMLEFLDKFNMRDLLPKKLAQIIENEKRELSDNLLYSSKEYEHIEKKVEYYSTFPDYDKLPLRKEITGTNNIFLAKWNEKKNQ